MGDAVVAANDSKGQGVIDCMTVLPCVARHLGGEALERIATLFKAVCATVESRFAVIRFAAAQCLAELGDIMPVLALREVVVTLVPLLGDPLNVNRRRGVIEVISRTTIPIGDSLTFTDCAV